MKRILPGLALCLASAPALAAPDVTGQWLTQDRSAIIKLAPCGSHLCGTVAKVLVNRPGIPKTDARNPNPALRDRPIQGLRVISGLSPAATRWEGGQIYDPKSGKSYRSHLSLDPGGTLKISGCFTFICRTQHWTRVR